MSAVVVTSYGAKGIREGLCSCLATGLDQSPGVLGSGIEMGLWECPFERQWDELKPSGEFRRVLNRCEADAAKATVQGESFAFGPPA